MYRNLYYLYVFDKCVILFVFYHVVSYCIVHYEIYYKFAPLEITQ